MVDVKIEATTIADRLLALGWKRGEDSDKAIRDFLSELIAWREVGKKAGVRCTVKGLEQ